MARKVEFEFDPFEIAGVDKDQLPASVIRDALDDVKNYVLEQVLLDVAEQRSPVYGTKWKSLNKDYAKTKAKEGGTPIANLLLTGDMLDAVRIGTTGEKLLMRVLSSQSDKAEGHNQHNDPSNLPIRRFVPNADDDESFRPGIREGIKDIINQAIDGVRITTEGDNGN